MRPKRYTRAEQRTLREEGKCARWNEAHPIGTRVIFQEPLRRVEGETRTKAQVLGGHTAVLWMTGVVGCVGLDWVTVAPTPST